MLTIIDPSAAPDADTLLLVYVLERAFPIIVKVSVAVQLFSVFVTDKI